jgi:hypothetical protein
MPAMTRTVSSSVIVQMRATVGATSVEHEQRHRGNPEGGS